MKALAWKPGEHFDFEREPSRSRTLFYRVRRQVTHYFTLAVDIVTQLITMFEDHYPERLKKVYVINGESISAAPKLGQCVSKQMCLAPKYFPLAYALVKPFLAEETARKVFVYAKGTIIGVNHPNNGKDV